MRIGVIVLAVMLMGLQAIAGEKPTAQELLDKFAQNADKIDTSFITQSKGTSVFNNQFSGAVAWMSGKKERHGLTEFRTDGKRLKMITQQWGTFFSGNKPIWRSEQDAQYASHTYDGDKGYQYVAVGKDPGGVHIISDKKGWLTVNQELSAMPTVSTLMGHLAGDNERFDRILKKAAPGQVTVRDKMEYLNGTAHYVIDAKTEYGQYTIWLNPEKGYNFTKAEYLKKSGDRYNGIKLSGSQRKNIIENTAFLDVNGVWVPSKGREQTEHIFKTSKSEGLTKGTVDIELTSIVINPDHDALGSFKIDDIRDGARVLLIGGPPGWFIWKDGKAIPDPAKVNKSK